MSGPFQQLLSVAKITAGLATAPYTLAFTKSTRLKFTGTQYRTFIVK